MVIALCEKCGKKYELDDDENPEDCQCECGGTLKYVENIGDTIQEFNQKLILMTCPLCGTENSEKAQLCAFCGNNLSEENESNIKDPKKEVEYSFWTGKPKNAPEGITSTGKSLKQNENKISIWTGKSVKKYVKNENDGKFKVFWKSRDDKEKAFILIIGIIILIGIAYAIFSPKITPLAISSPVSLENTEIGKYSYENHTISNSTTSIKIEGKTEPGANVTAYVIYSNVTYYGSILSKIPNEFRQHSAESDPHSPSIAEEDGIPTNIKVIEDGKFSLEIPTNPDPYGDTWIYITAKSPGKEKNTIELILTHLTESTSDLTPTSNTKPPTESQTPVDTTAAYAAGETQALIAINNGNPNMYLPKLGGHYTDAVIGESAEYKSWYDAGYIDRLKQEGYYP